jgi:hypothetical protein
MHYLSVRNKEDLQLKIIPFFTQYSINSEKHSDFLHFVSAVSIRFFFSSETELIKKNIKTRVKVLNTLLKNNVSI